MSDSQATNGSETGSRAFSPLGCVNKSITPEVEYSYANGSANTIGVPTGYDELDSYDELQRLSDQKRGTLNSDQTAITSSTFQQQWGLDATGNYTHIVEFRLKPGSIDSLISQSGRHNSVHSQLQHLPE